MIPKPERICRGCGKVLQRDSKHCKKCDLQIATLRLVDVAPAGPAKQPSWLTKQVFAEKIRPALANASATVIAKGIGVSRWYAGRIREGYTPHPRHWKALAELVGLSANNHI